jgi:hypothetical protein
MAFRILAANPYQPWPVVILFMEKLEEARLERLADDVSSRRLLWARNLCFVLWGRCSGALPSVLDSSDDSSGSEDDSSDEIGMVILNQARLGLGVFLTDVAETRSSGDPPLVHYTKKM